MARTGQDGLIPGSHLPAREDLCIRKQMEIGQLRPKSAFEGCLRALLEVPDKWDAGVLCQNMVGERDACQLRRA